MVLEKTLEGPLDCKEIKPVHPKGNQLWIFIGRTDVEAETVILWPPDAKKWLIWKDPDAGKDWGQEEKGMTEDEMVGWHHRLSGHGFGWNPGVGDGQGRLAGCIYGVEKSQTRLSDWTELNWWNFLILKNYEKNKYNVFLITVLNRQVMSVSPWTAAGQASLSFTVFWNLLKFMSIESIMLSRHLVLCCPFFSSCPQSFPASGTFRVSLFFTSGGQSIEVSASVLRMNIHGWLPLWLTGLISLLSKELSRALQHCCSKALILWHSAFFMVNVSQLYMTTEA